MPSRSCPLHLLPFETGLPGMSRWVTAQKWMNCETRCRGKPLPLFSATPSHLSRCKPPAITVISSALSLAIARYPSLSCASGIVRRAAMILIAATITSSGILLLMSALRCSVYGRVAGVPSERSPCTTALKNCGWVGMQLG